MDRDQFLTLVIENKKLIFKVCRAYCRDAEDREDLAQEIIIQLWRSSARYDDRQKLSTWIYRIALNVAISAHRREIRRSKTAGEVRDVFLSFSDHQWNEQESDHDIQLLYQFIDDLSELNKALMLLYLDDRGYAEIANILGISQTNVATKISRIKVALRQKFESVKKEPNRGIG
ncbi:MAG: RNA polymerase sigma factor [Candidatus Latescibacteria bacterium]|jgi:RNA polymerase sigma factor (sigma-70 family)|nr:RNA polymerase sigma factor [Candidatus Latescibacterota bacterium]